jgi:hypothetical protein
MKPSIRGKRHSMMHLSQLLGALLLLGSSILALAETVFQVAVGSYSSLDNARRAASVANAELGLGHQVVRTTTDSGELYRVLSRDYGSRQAGRRGGCHCKKSPRKWRMDSDLTARGAGASAS